MGATVSYGLYIRFNQAELDLEWSKYKQAVQTRSDHAAASGGGLMAMGSYAGKSVSWTFPSGIGSIEQWRIELENAQADLDDLEPVYMTRGYIGAS